MKQNAKYLIPIFKVLGVIGSFTFLAGIILVPIVFAYVFIFNLEIIQTGIRPEIQYFFKSNKYAVLFTMAMFLQEIFMIITVIFAWRFIEKKPLAEMGLPSILSKKKDFGAGLILGAVSITLVFAVIVLTGNAKLTTPLTSPKFSAGILFYLVLYILVGFAEELLTRGYAMSVFKQKYNIYFTVGISAFIFTMLHITNNNVSVIGLIDLFLTGVLFSYMFIKSGNIYMPIGYHITWNFFQGCVWGMNVSGFKNPSIYSIEILENNIINGGAFGAEGGIVSVAVNFLVMVFVWFYYRKGEYKFMDK